MCSWQPLQYVTSAFGNDCLHHIKITRDKISKRPFSYSGKSLCTLLFSKIRAGGASSCNNDTIWEKFEHCFIARMMMISQNCGANISELSHKGTPLPPSLQFKYIKYIVEIYQIYSWNISNISEHFQRDSIPPLHPVLRVHVISLDVPPVPLMTWNTPLDIWLDLLSIKPIVESQQREFWGWQNVICDTPGSPHGLRMSSE